MTPSATLPELVIPPDIAALREHCVLWTGRVNDNGYGQRGKTLVHREALGKKLGRPVHADLDACHTCDVRLCFNPDHLYEGTRRQNMADCTERGRHNKPSGETHWTAKLSAADVIEVRRLAGEGRNYGEIGRRFRVHPATASRIARGLWRTEVAL